MNVFSTTIAGAIAIHAAAAVGVIAFGVPRGPSGHVVASGPTLIEVDEVAPAPETKVPDVVHADRVAPALAARGIATQARTAPAPVIVAPHDAPGADTVPLPEPSGQVVTHFKMTLAAQAGVLGAGVADGVMGEGDVTERARQVGGVKPEYPAQARARGVQLDAPLPFEIVVDTSGRVEDARSLSHAGYGFDEAAISALRSYRFTPAVRNGHAVRVRMRWTVDFQLRATGS